MHLDKEQYNAAIKYIEKNQYRVSLQNSKAIVWFITAVGLVMFFYILRFIVALP